MCTISAAKSGRAWLVLPPSPILKAQLPSSAGHKRGHEYVISGTEANLWRDRGRHNTAMSISINIDNKKFPTPPRQPGRRPLCVSPYETVTRVRRAPLYVSGRAAFEVRVHSSCMATAFRRGLPQLSLRRLAKPRNHEGTRSAQLVARVWCCGYSRAARYLARCMAWSER